METMGYIGQNAVIFSSYFWMRHFPDHSLFPYPISLLTMSLEIC